MKSAMKIAVASLAFLSFGLSTSASASSVVGAHVTHIIPNNAGVLQFNLDTARTGLPACTTASTSFTINVNTLAGQTMAAALMTAMASNLPIDIGGTGTCEFAGVEAVGYLAIHR
jgi:hypothetical protein